MLRQESWSFPIQIGSGILLTNENLYYRLTYAVARWLETRAGCDLAQFKQAAMRADKARTELGWLPRHDSIISYILKEIPRRQIASTGSAESSRPTCDSNSAFTRKQNMQNEIYSIYHLAIAPSDYAAFEKLIQPIVAATREEPDTTIYEYFVNADRTVVHIIERYRTKGLLPHVEQTFTPFAERFLKLATIKKLFVYGDTTPEIRAKLDGFGAEYLMPFAGFSR